MNFIPVLRLLFLAQLWEQESGRGRRRCCLGERGRGAWTEHEAVCLAPALLVTCTVVGAKTWDLLFPPLAME